MREKPIIPTREELKPEEPTQSIGDAHRPEHLEVDEGGPGAVVPDAAGIARDELDHEGLDVELPADEAISPDVPVPPKPVKDHPSRWSGPTR